MANFDKTGVASFKRVRLQSRNLTDLFIGQGGRIDFGKAMALVDEVKVNTVF